MIFPFSRLRVLTNGMITPPPPLSLSASWPRMGRPLLNGKLQVHIGSGVGRGPSLGYHSLSRYILLIHINTNTACLVLPTHECL